MFRRHVEKINHLLLDQREEQSSLRDSFALLTSRTSGHRPCPRRSVSTPKPKYLSEITLIRQDVPSKYTKTLEDLFRTRCSALALDFNEANWDAFVKAFTSKNKFKTGDFCDGTLNLSHLGFSEPCLSQIN
jgi:hypothetical protein